MKHILQQKRGMTVTELTLYALVAGIFLAFFILFFWRTRRLHEQQTLGLSYQGSFARLCDQLEKDLAGCRLWRTSGEVGTSSTLLIDRGDNLIITYDIQMGTGEIVRNMQEIRTIFPFRGEKEVFLKTLEFARPQDNPNSLSLKIGLKTTPPIELSHDFFIRVSVHKNPGYFDEADLSKKATGHIHH
jgi:hypothetical protein